MSAGCAIVASDTAPVAEAIENNKTGRLINFFNHGELAENIIDILKDKEKANIFGIVGVSGDLIANHKTSMSCLSCARYC